VRLFHFSEEQNITKFVPRPVTVPARRPAGMEWLNGSLVWAIAHSHQKLYLFPRECPRILLWATAQTTLNDVDYWLQGNRERTLAYIENRWLQRFQQVRLFRYEFTSGDFVNLKDAGMWVAKTAVHPIDCVQVSNLSLKLDECNTELIPVDSLIPLKDAWASTVHASGIRLRNASG